MNKKLILLIMLLVTIHGYAEEPSFGLDNLTSDYENMLNNSADLNLSFERRFQAINHERALAGKLFDEKKIGKAEYDQRIKQLDGQEARLNADRQDAKNNGQKIADSIHDIAVSSYKRKLAHDAAEEERETKIGQAIATAEINNEGTMNRFKYLMNPNTLLKLGVTFGGCFGLYHLENYAYKYFEAKLGLPTLIRESSRMSKFRAWFPWFFKKPISQDEAFASVILAPDVQTKIRSLAYATTRTHAEGLPYQNLLLYGQPGTGKTLIAKTLAHASGMDFAIMSGADFSQFKAGDDVKELHKLFDWAKYGKRGLILFIDEADAFLKDRSQGCDDRRLNLVNAFLSQTNTSSEKIMIILASNYAENLDTAVLSRINKKIEIPLPGLDERIKILNFYIDKRLKQPQKNGRQLVVHHTINDRYITEIAKKIDGFSGRTIEQCITEISIEGLIGSGTVNTEIFDRVVQDRIQQHQKEKTWKVYDL